jgi:hypothetical protein
MVQVYPQNNPCGEDGCASLQGNFQWTDDGGTQTMGNGNFQTLLQLNLFNAGNGSCTLLNGGVCEPMVPASTDFPGGIFLVRANAGTPLIYSVSLISAGSPIAPYDYFMTVEQLE